MKGRGQRGKGGSSAPNRSLTSMGISLEKGKQKETTASALPLEQHWGAAMAVGPRPIPDSDDDALQPKRVKTEEGVKTEGGPVATGDCAPFLNIVSGAGFQNLTAVAKLLRCTELEIKHELPPGGPRELGKARKNASTAKKFFSKATEAGDARSYTCRVRMSSSIPSSASVVLSCDKIIKIQGTSTSSLGRHMQAWHLPLWALSCGDYPLVPVGDESEEKFLFTSPDYRLRKQAIVRAFAKSGEAPEKAEGELVRGIMGALEPRMPYLSAY